VRDFIVGNEPNKALFWQPVFNRNGTGASCGSYEQATVYRLPRASDRSDVEVVTVHRRTGALDIIVGRVVDRSGEALGI